MRIVAIFILFFILIIVICDKYLFTLPYSLLML